MKSISWNALRAAEIRAEANNRRISAEAQPDGGELEIITKRKAFQLVKKRPINSHKGCFGKLLCITGSDRFPGAAQISAIAALKSGVGLVNVFSTENCCRALSVSAKEATLIPCPCDGDGFILPDERAKRLLAEAASSASAILIGCGLGKSCGGSEAIGIAFENANCPIIIDADGINLVSDCIELLRKARTELILTPHPAELGRLTGVCTDEALNLRYPLAKKLSDDFGAVVAAKACATVIASPNGDFVSMFGNDGLAKGGSGDLLAGLIASFAAQGINPQDAAKLGTVLLGVSCEAVSKRLSKTGMTASDILNYLPRLFKKFERA